ncbi:MAG: hypothetical protein AAF633_22945, partial [Chloroflexota bacterium]
ADETAPDQIPSQEAMDVVERAWELAYESGSYAFRTDMLQTTSLAQSLENAGRNDRNDRIYIEGNADRIEKRLFTEMWRAGYEEQAISVKMIDGKSYGRVGQSEWEEIDGYTDMFAPAGDPMAFLSGAVNIQAAGEETRSFTHPDGGDFSLVFTRYTFDLDGPAFASYVRKDLETTLQASGQLPQGMSLSTSDQFAKAEGQGEIWLSEEGLPSYLMIDMDLPRQPNGDEVTAVIHTEFMDYDMDRIAASQTSLAESPTIWVDHQLALLTENQNQILALLLIFLSMTAFSLLIILNWRSPVLYNCLAALIITSMLVGPLLHSREVSAFYDEQRERHAEMEVEKEKIERDEQVAASLRETDFDPQSDPYETPSEFALQKEIDAFSQEAFGIGAAGSSDLNAVAVQSVQSSVIITSTDTDGDGLSDADEFYWRSCAFANAPNYCVGVVDSTDSDADGLNDGDEVNRLGTDPSLDDTDSDTIPDNLEIGGFVDANSRTWFLDPKEADSNKDGLSDGVECRVWVSTDPSYDVTAPCPDTDSDGTPDVFDDDNDNDGIADDVDLSPFSVDQTDYNKDNRLKVQFNNLTPNTPTYLNLQMIPKDRSNLTILGNIYNWPSGDNRGQIQRVRDTTWANSSNMNIRSTSSNASDGDMRVIPYLEILIPYQAGHFGNLPVKSSFTGITRTRGITVGQWLDDSELRQFGIMVEDAAGNSGDLQVLVPLNLVSDSQGGGPVAFNAKMLYTPTQGTGNIADWGNAHELRLVWFVQMITDRCPSVTPNCAANERVEAISVIHVYDDAWNLGGISTDQDFGLKVGLLYEDPAVDNDRKVDDYLWAASAFLSNAFIRGIDCPVIALDGCDASLQDQRRDVTVNNAVSAIDSWFGSPSNIAGEIYTFTHEAYISHIWVTHTVSILNDNFNTYQAEGLSPTIMTLKEGIKQGVNLEEATFSNGTATFDFDDSKVPKFTVASMNWATYYDADNSAQTAKWANYDLESYLELLDAQLLNEVYFQAVGNSPDDKDASLGKRYYAQLYYQA